ncbi:MAG: tetratricopeptide repeat protein [Limnochordaceae bacterium]|nr:tetratricopeptide repeat protein [Limnochordaceae bacterium]
MELQARIGQRIRRRREELGMTQQELAGPELTRGFISQLEKGIVLPSLKSLELIAARLYKPVAYFLEETPASLPSEEQASRAILARALEVAACAGAGRAEELLGELSPVPIDRQAGNGTWSALEAAVLAVRVLSSLEKSGTDAPEQWQRALAGLRASPGWTREAGYALAARGLLLARQGRWADSVPPLEEAARLLAGSEGQETCLVQRITTCLAIAYARSGQEQRAAPMLRQALEEQRASRSAFMPVQVLLALGRCAASAHAWDEAAELVERAQSVARAIGATSDLAEVWEARAELARKTGRLSEAAQALSESARLWGETGQASDQGRVLARLSEILEASGRVPEALQQAEHALAVVDRGVERVRLLARMGRLVAREGREDEAKGYIDEALHLLQGHQGDPGLVREMALACSEVGRVLRSHGDHERAGELLARAVELYQQAGPVRGD